MTLLASKCFRALGRSGDADAGEDTVKVRYTPDYEFDLLESMHIYLQTPALALHDQYVQTHRFRFADDLCRNIVNEATFSDGKEIFQTLRRFSSLILEQFFVEETRRHQNVSSINERQEVYQWSTAKRACNLEAAECWPFALEPSKALELFRFKKSAQITHKETSRFTYEFILNVWRHLQIQQRIEGKWIDLKPTDKLCSELFVNFTKKFELPQLYAAVVNITETEKSRRLETNFTFIFSTFEFQMKNKCKPDKEKAISISNPALTTFVAFGVQNVTGVDMNYSDSYTGSYNNPQSNVLPIKNASVVHTLNEQNVSYVFEKLPPLLLSSDMLTRDHNARPDKHGLYGVSFAGTHYKGRFGGGCYTKGCKTQVRCVLEDAQVLNPGSWYIIRVCCLTLRKLTYQADGSIVYDLEKAD
jgi:hypothetical protein